MSDFSIFILIFALFGVITIIVGLVACVWIMLFKEYSPLDNEDNQGPDKWGF